MYYHVPLFDAAAFLRAAHLIVCCCSLTVIDLGSVQ